MSHSTTSRRLSRRAPAVRAPTVGAMAVVALVVALAGLLSACSSEDGDNNLPCTLIGCTDQVTLRALDPAGNVVVKVQGIVIADGKTIAVNCLSGTGGPDYFCSPGGVVVATGATSLVVNLSSGDLGVTALVVTPSYVTTRPNGPKCDPVCKQAVVNVQLGGGLVDAGGTDTASTDTASTDTGADAGEVDGISDVGAADATAPDTTPVDSGASDTGGADSSAGDVSGGDVSGGDVSGGDVSAGDTTSTQPGCCKTAADCSKGHVCAGSVCKDSSQLKSGECWVDADCATGLCKSPNVCPCGASCFAPDSPGACPAAATCSKIDPNGYGTCEMLMGVGWDGSKCAFVSGCGCKEDCAKFFKDMAACEAACIKAS